MKYYFIFINLVLKWAANYDAFKNRRIYMDERITEGHNQVENLSDKKDVILRDFSDYVSGWDVIKSKEAASDSNPPFNDIFDEPVTGVIGLFPTLSLILFTILSAILCTDIGTL